MKTAALLALLLLAPVSAQAQQDHGHRTHSPYSGQETREIKSLSPRDIEELRRGGGWGLARAAELNGMPGPAHLLELKDEIPLASGQAARIREIYETMRAEAIAEGERLIARERALETAFRERSVGEESLRRLLTAIEESRTALRFIHLSTHLSALRIVSDDQVARYNALRGYDIPAAAPQRSDRGRHRPHAPDDRR